ncbi:hypothetical protein [Paraburkholderia saeva]|uniref:hypothetical protein n=1 Tax=Paraburkholderia saeva TaxID=2777537 RepID=UPI001D48AEEB|nr:hypothetical protein [Paraburkholderia saeva]CAG4923141.1 hypothetical protein R52603_05137 [Paraburkholderia saeva]
MASLYDEARTLISDLTAIRGRQTYYLGVPGAHSAAQLSAVSFDASEKMDEPNVVRIVLTHPGQLGRADYLSRDAVFRIVPDDGMPKTFSGYIERFSTIQTTKDFRKYEIALKFHVGRLAGINGTVRISAKTELVLECGGAFIQLKDGNITLGGPADLFFKVITIQKKGAASMQISPKLPTSNDLPDLSGHGSRFSG